MEWKGVIKGVWWSNLLTTSILIIYLLTHSLTLPPAPPLPPTQACVHLLSSSL